MLPLFGVRRCATNACVKTPWVRDINAAWTWSLNRCYHAVHLWETSFQGSVKWQGRLFISIAALFCWNAGAGVLRVATKQGQAMPLLFCHARPPSNPSCAAPDEQFEELVSEEQRVLIKL